MMDPNVRSNVYAAGLFSLLIILICIAAIVGAWNG